MYRIPGNFRVTKLSQNNNYVKIFLQIIHMCNIKGVALQFNFVTEQNSRNL